MSNKTKVTLQFETPETARKTFNLLTDLKAWRCGLRAIASTIRRLIQEAKITRE
jgi:hypothetical protein